MSCTITVLELCVEDEDVDADISLYAVLM